MASSALLAY